MITSSPPLSQELGFRLHSSPPMYTLEPSLHFFRSCFPQVPSASRLPVPCASRPARPFALPLLPSSGLVSSAFCYAPSRHLLTVSPLRISAFHSIPFGTSSDDLCFPSASRLRYSPHTLSCAPAPDLSFAPPCFLALAPPQDLRLVLHSPRALFPASFPPPSLPRFPASHFSYRFALALLPPRFSFPSVPFRSLPFLFCSASASLQLSPLFCAVPLRPASPFTSQRSFSRQPFGCRQAPLTFPSQFRPSSLRLPLCFRSLLTLPAACSRLRPQMICFRFRYSPMLATLTFALCNLPKTFRFSCASCCLSDSLISISPTPTFVKHFF